MIANDKKKQSYFDKFSDFAGYLAKGCELSEKQAEMTIDWFSKVKRQDKDNKIAGYLNFVDEMARVGMSILVEVQDIEFIYDHMLTYYDGCHKSGDESEKAKDVMLETLTKYRKDMGFNEDNFWFFARMIGRSINKGDPMKEINEIKMALSKSKSTTQSSD